MKLLQRLTIILFVLVTAAFVGTELYTRFMTDSCPPRISFDSEIIEISVSAEEDELLKGVHATDDSDGDISSQVIINGISQLITSDTAQVSYVVFDSSNNMATATRSLRYTDYEKPRFALDEPLIFHTSQQIKLLELIRAHDVIDGDISGSIRITRQNVESSTPGVYSVTFQVTNSMGDTETLPAKVIIRDDVPHYPPMELSTYILYLPAGEDFDPMDYVSLRSEDALPEVVSNVDSSLPGIYEVCYSLGNYVLYLSVVVV